MDYHRGSAAATASDGKHMASIYVYLKREHAHHARRSFLAAQFICLATETTSREIVVAFCPKHGLRSDLRAPNFKNLPGGASPRPP